MGEWVFGRLDAARALRDLADARINYSLDEVRRPTWNIDTHRSALPAERPGPPEPQGPWENACALVRDYEFSPPELVRALYDPTAPLLGHDMLLEARSTACTSTAASVSPMCWTRAGRTVTGSGGGHTTLEGHLERGKVTYEVVKRQETGEVEFVASSHSQGSPTLDPITFLGWRMFGRRTQLRFYRRCGDRLRAFVEAALRGYRPQFGPPTVVDHLVFAPSDAKTQRLARLAIHRVAPG